MRTVFGAAKYSESPELNRTEVAVASTAVGTALQVLHLI